MSKLFEDDSPATVAQAFRVTLLRLTPHTELAAVRDDLSAARAAVEVAMVALQAAQDAVIAQTAQINFDDRLLDRAVVDCARALRGSITGARPDERPSFRRLFPTSPSKAMDGGPDAEQDHYVAVVLAGLEAPEHAALAAAHAPQIRARQAAVTAAVAARAELEASAALREAELLRAVAAARVAFNEAQLDAAASTKDEALVASLFDFRPSRPAKKAPATPK